MLVGVQSHIPRARACSLFFIDSFFFFSASVFFIIGHVAVLLFSSLPLVARSGQRTFVQEYTSILLLKSEVTY